MKNEKRKIKNEVKIKSESMKTNGNASLHPWGELEGG